MATFKVTVDFDLLSEENKTMEVEVTAATYFVSWSGALVFDDEQGLAIRSIRYWAEVEKV